MEGYKNFGIMLDCSRIGVMNIESVKRFMDTTVKMGYDSLMLYTEDTFEVEDEPYLGYLRGRYTQKEIKELDAYGKSIGMELIPCIQTLAHFTHAVRWNRFKQITDVNDILLIDDEGTYEFLERLIKSVSEAFTSKKINIGMDEAHMVGLGKYLDEHGYTNRSSLVLKHLNRVNQILEKYDFEPIMWSDMFYRLAAKGEYYTDVTISDEVKALVPKNISLAYWDYYHKDKAHYDRMLKSHKGFNNDVWFAGGAWSWNGFAPFNDYSIMTMKPAMQSVVENNIENVLITMWGDNGKECSFFALLPSLYAISEYGKGNFDEQKIKDGFKKLIGISYDDFMLVDLPNRRAIDAPCVINENPSKSMLYADCFMGLFDDLVEKVGKIDYGLFAEKLNAFASENSYGYVFNYLAKLCAVLDIKYDLGVRTRSAYLQKDKTALTKIIADYEKVSQRLDEFYEAFKLYWDTDNKVFGFEVHQARLGGLMLRIKECKSRLNDFISGKISSIPELEEEILPTGEVPNAFYLNVYNKNFSVSII